MGCIGGGSSSSTTPKASAAEKLMRPLVVKRATDPGMTDSAQLARGMATERLSRLNEDAPLDSRTAGILSFFMPQMTAARDVSGQLLGDFANAPTASPLGVGGYGGKGATSFGSQPVDLAAVLSPENVRGSFSEYSGDLIGSKPSADFASSTKAAGTQLSSEMVNALLGETTPGEQDQNLIGQFAERFLKKKKSEDLWNAIFGVVGDDAGGGGS